MSRRNRNRQRTGGMGKLLGWNGDCYWATDAYNQRLYVAYRDLISRLLLTRYRWVNLPATCDAWALERTLLYKGVATIARPVKGDAAGFWYNTAIAAIGEPNIYGKPSSWYSIAPVRNWRFRCDHRNAALVYDSPTMLPIGNLVDLYARELVDIRKTMQMNRMHQKVPYLLVTPNDQELTAINLLKQVLGGEPAVVGNPSIRDIDFEVLKFDVPYLGSELNEAWDALWRDVYFMAGLSSMPDKSERLVAAEVKATNEPATVEALSGLWMRRDAIDHLRRIDLSTFADTQCVWNRDNESDNYNLTHNLAALGIGGGAENVTI